MKFSTVLSLLIVVSTLNNSAAEGEKDSGVFSEEDSGSYLRAGNDENYRRLTEGLSIATESRIVGGTNAPTNAYPFFVSWGGCGASLVASDVILTAAHCRGQSSNRAIVGESIKNQNGEQRRIIRRISHPSYRSGSINYDYMVMKLDEPVDTSVYPYIKLNSNSNVPFGREELTVIGFGALRESGSNTPSRLQQVNVNYIQTSECNQRSSYNGDVRDSTMFCAGTGGGKDSCQGDSGGPIFIQRSGQEVEQVGIVSWGRGCAQSRYPGVYSRISGEFTWVKRQVCSLATDPPDFCGNNNGTPPDTIPITAPSPTRAPTRAPASAPEPEPVSLFDFLCSVFPVFC